MVSIETTRFFYLEIMSKGEVVIRYPNKNQTKNIGGIEMKQTTKERLKGMVIGLIIGSLTVGGGVFAKNATV